MSRGVLSVMYCCTTPNLRMWPGCIHMDLASSFQNDLQIHLLGFGAFEVLEPTMLVIKNAVLLTALRYALLSLGMF